MKTITIHNHTYEIPTEVLNHLEGLADAVKEWNMKRETLQLRPTKSTANQARLAYERMMKFLPKQNIVQTSLFDKA